MLRVDAGGSSGYCDGVSRRSFLQIGVAGLASFGLPGLLRLREASARDGKGKKDTRIILVWLDGGPSHMDTYDLKPEAPPEYRGFWSPIPTNVPGMRITEMFPRQAKVADKFSIIRSLFHNDGDHFGGAHRLLTGRAGATGADTTPRSPSIGSITAALAGARKPGVPAYVAIPYGMSVGIRPGYFGANYVGRPYDPFETDGDPNSKDFKIRNLSLPGGLTIERIGDRRTLQKSFDTIRREADQTGTFAAMDQFEKQAYELVTGPEVRKAFDLSGEDEKLRAAYGRNNWGQSVLLARRLAEAGVTFTTVHFGGWDHHWNLKEGMQSYLPKVDMAVATLFEDLSSRGLLEKTMVLVLGEFSRTPRMNDGSGQGTPGRDHWGGAMSVLIGGGGVRGGRVVGATDSRGEYPVERPLTPGDLHATIYTALGLDPHATFLNPAGRPVPAIDEGAPIKELL